MAKNRMVSTSYWSDHYIANLDPTEKLLFLYLLTNEKSTLAGIYELPKKLMAVETGIETEMVGKILRRFENDGKIKYQDGWVAVKNFLKHHEQGSPTVIKAISDALKQAPEWARAFVGKGIDTLSPSSFTLASTSISAPRVEIVKVPPEGTEKRESTAKYPNARKLFAGVWGANYPRNWNTNTTELVSGENLFVEHGIDESKEAYDFSQKHQKEEFFPKIRKPSDLDRKWIELEAKL